VQLRQPQYGVWMTKTLIAQHRFRFIPMPRSRVNSFSRITLCATVIITWRVCVPESQREIR
jgi:hypothetical protein